MPEPSVPRAAATRPAPGALLSLAIGASAESGDGLRGAAAVVFRPTLDRLDVSRDAMASPGPSREKQAA